ncbi:MAG: aldo/keto reductase [Oscillospiraceae bacterium]|nr:aldo/keto reductase [Oscillospiraceae bacterium]
MTESYLGESIGKLGFGNMRLPKKDGVVDDNTANDMVDEFLANGFTYIDTAYLYGGSEESLRESLVKRHPREAYQIATKLTLLFGVENYDDHFKQLNTSLERLGLDYLDFYLIHGLSGETIKTAEKAETWRFMRHVKEAGIAGHIGFSFHSTPEDLEYVLSNHPEVEFVQLQLNYIDWENPEVQSRRLYEIARKYGKPIVIMEPTKGGLLAGGESAAAEVLREANPEASVASWAFRFVGSLEGIITVLSGMENTEQIKDNAKTFKEFKPLTEEERLVIGKAIEILNSTQRIPCTTCRYCVPHCPSKIQIPTFIDIYNKYLMHRQRDSSGYTYASMSAFGAGPAECVKCRECERVCPQHIGISDVMSQLVSELEEASVPYRRR